MFYITLDRGNIFSASTVIALKASSPSTNKNPIHCQTKKTQDKEVVAKYRRPHKDSR